MKKNELLKCGDSVIRILEIKNDSALIVDCIHKAMPQWIQQSDLASYAPCTEQELTSATGKTICDYDSLDKKSRRFVHEHFTLIAGVLPFIGDDRLRCSMISSISAEKGMSKQTIRNYLWLYLVYQDIAALAPKQKQQDKPLTQDEKNMRWALNKFFYTRHKNSLNTAYTLMLKEKYCDSSGVLLSEYPSINQFRYFYRKYNKMQTYYISREGLKKYQRNHRPLLGDGVQEFAPSIGVGMLDATICDIYLVDNAGNLIGRPILTACVDAYSGLCCGYSLSWEGGVYSLRNLMVNVIADKVEWCKRFGISIQREDWDCNQLPSTLVTDMGSEYKSANIEQLAELGVTIVNLPSFRPELKGNVRLMALSDLYRIYLPSQMSMEIYSKLYLSLLRSLQKKNTTLAIQQRYQNNKAIQQQAYSGIMGGSDSYTIIGASGIGKSSAISRAISLITEKRLIETKMPHSKIIPCLMVQCPFDSSVKGLLLEILRKADEKLGTTYYQYAIKSRASTVDMLIGTVSTVALNHIGLLVVDEIQNVANSKNGKNLVGMLTMLINNSGISICMVGTPESSTFFSKEMQLARRSLGLRYDRLQYDQYFHDFCCTLFRYQYTKQKTEISPAIIEWLYEHSSGVISVVVSLIHDAQELAILNGTEELNMATLNEAYEKRLSMLHGYIAPTIKRRPQCSTPKKKSSAASIIPVQAKADEGISISDLVAIAKNDGIDIVSLLKQHMPLVEVAI